MADVEAERVSPPGEPSAREHREPNYLQVIEIAILGLATVATAWSAIVSSNTLHDSRKQAEEARQKAIEETRYAMQRDGLKAFVDGYSAFATAIYTIRNRLPVDIEDPSQVDRMTPAQMAELREITIPIIAAQYSYYDNFRSALSAWPKPIRSQLVETAKLAGEIAKCFEAGSYRALDSKETAGVKRDLNTNCRSLGAKNNAFHNSSDALYAAMVNEVVESATRLGADPDKTPPLPRPS